MRPETDLAMSECMHFFPVYTVKEQIRSVSHMSKKKRNWVTTDRVNGALVLKYSVLAVLEYSDQHAQGCLIRVRAKLHRNDPDLRIPAV